MKHKYADTRLVAMAVVLGMSAACFGGGEEVADAQPSETLEASEERTSEEEAAGDEDFDNCEDLRARAEAEAPQWMSEWSQERVRECMES